MILKDKYVVLQVFFSVVLPALYSIGISVRIIVFLIGLNIFLF